jgi:uncharacterized protein (DUF2062 family)
MKPLKKLALLLFLAGIVVVGVLAVVATTCLLCVIFGCTFNIGSFVVGGQTRMGSFIQFLGYDVATFVLLVCVMLFGSRIDD